MSIFFNYNGNIYKEHTAVINPLSRGFKYGDGLFETMKMIGEKLVFSQDHFDRLFYGMEILHFNIPEYFTIPYLEDKISALAKKNDHLKSSKVRLTVFRGNGDIDNSSNDPEYIIQTSEILFSAGLNNDGLAIDIYPYSRKSCDQLANIKTNNFLSYVMAAAHAKKNKLNDCILLNNYERLCDTSIANIFLIKNEKIYTPPLSEGCIAGIVRKQLLSNLKDYNITEKAITQDQLKDADEVFLTNSIYELRWVKFFKNIEYKNTLTRNIYHSFIKTI